MINDNADKIREKIGKAKSEAFKNVASEMVGLIVQPLEEALSLLPKPCEKCGGTGEVTQVIGDPCTVPMKTRQIPCPACSQAPAQCETCGGSEEVRCDAGCYKGKDDIYEQINPAHFQKCLKCNGEGFIPCPACQAPAVEEFVKAMRNEYTSKLPNSMQKDLLQALTHLTEQAKQIERLEGEKKELKEEINRIHGRVVGRQKLKEHGIEYKD